MYRSVFAQRAIYSLRKSFWAIPFLGIVICTAYLLLENPAQIDLKLIYDKLQNADYGDMGDSVPENNQFDVNPFDKSNGINVWLSERIPLQRRLKDFRDIRCSKMALGLQEPTSYVSIIMVYYMEHVSVLLRAVHSIFNRTPKHLLLELIIVDDASPEDELDKKKLDKYLLQFFGNKIRLIELEQHMGTANARIHAAGLTKGHTLVFLEPSIEVTKDWLPPLLRPILEDRKTITIPSVDSINSKNFGYETRAPVHGVFDWNLFIEISPTDKNKSENYPLPYETPAISGTMFAVQRTWFLELIADNDMTVTFSIEAVLVELSIKTWLCGGRLLQVPCSRLGYIMTNDLLTKKEVQMNEYQKYYTLLQYKRIVEIWLSNSYKEFVYKVHPVLKGVYIRNPHHYKVFQQKHKCYPFEFYLEYITVELLSYQPTASENVYAAGQIFFKKSFCLDTAVDRKTNISHASLRPCEFLSSTQETFNSSRCWYFTTKRELWQQQSCLSVHTPIKNTPLIMIYKCRVEKQFRLWNYDHKAEKIEFHIENNLNKKLCLEADSIKKRVFLNDCIKNNANQRWKFESAKQRKKYNLF